MFGNIIPKHHFLTHYVRAARKLGPLCDVSAKRGEGKHRFFTVVARSMTSRVNAAYTLALKHQLHWTHKILTKEALVNRVTYGVSREKHLRSLKNYTKFNNTVPIHSVDPIVNVISWIKYDATLYKPGTVICTDKSGEVPVFGNIHYIIESIKVVYFIINTLVTIHMREHIQAYLVEESESWKFITEDDLPTHVTTNYQILPSGEFAIPQVYY